MHVFYLGAAHRFPSPELALPNGLLAMGGDLSPERLLLAYRQGIFPWYSEGEPILWWSPHPRFILVPEELNLPRSMRQLLKKHVFSCSYDRAFEDVIAGCRSPRKGQTETWITDEMCEAYVRLHQLGFAHSVEVWQGEKLAGGLYGVSLGRCFSGESMFSRVSNASKVAFIFLVAKLRQAGFSLIDCQVYSSHLHMLGARNVPRSTFLQLLALALEGPTLRGNWGMLEFLL